MLDGSAKALFTESPSADKPFGIGCDAAGIVVEVGDAVSRLNIGDQVYSYAIPKMINTMNARGTMADYIVVEEDLVATKPSNLTFDEAASLPAVAVTSYHALFEHAKLQMGETVLILGGSSATGIAGIQLAHSIGTRVITTTSARNVDFVKTIGADQVIDYHTEKWSEVLEHHSVDVIYDCGVEADAWNFAQHILKKDTGRFVTLLPMKQPVEPALCRAKNLGFIGAFPSAKDLDTITTLVENGELVPVIDSIYPFEELPKALTKLQGGHARGKIIIQISKPI